MLAGAPLLVAQLSELEFRRRMLNGNADALRNIRLGTQLTAGEFLKILGTLPPLALLRLCNRDFGDYAATQKDNVTIGG